MSPVLVRELSAAARDAAVAELVRSANETLAAAEERRAAVMADPPVPSRSPPARSPHWTEEARSRAAARGRGRSPEPISGTGDELDSQILITHDGTVVASDADPSPRPAVLVAVLARSLRGLGP